MLRDFPTLAHQSATLRKLRLDLGVSQAFLATVVHVNTRSWQKWEAGERSMHLAFYDLLRRRLIELGYIKPERT